MYECVLCLGNKLQVEILISELQSKLWKWHLRALNHGPHPVRSQEYLQKTPAHPCAQSQTCVWMGAVFLTLKWTPGEHGFGVAQLIKVPTLFVLTNKMVQSIFVQCFRDCAVYCYPEAHFLSKFVMLLVSGTFFFPTSEINEISISHSTQWLCLFSPPNKWHLVQF